MSIRKSVLKSIKKHKAEVVEESEKDGYDNEEDEYDEEDSDSGYYDESGEDQENTPPSSFVGISITKIDQFDPEAFSKELLNIIIIEIVK